ncbi:MAG TPA: hypothetical protein VGT98_03960 [Candidatus Elarobacter sp.]|nr:hypothetical protein [Candidatus Elarobacter sp.]
MSRATQVAVVAALAGTLLLATSSAAPQPSPSRVAASAAAPGACFANHPCPGPHATICFASAVVREPACPAPKMTYSFAQAPHGEPR